MDQDGTVKKGKHWKEGAAAYSKGNMVVLVCGRIRGIGGKEGSWKEGGFRSFWDTEIYILIDGGFLAITMGV